jgi:3-hydroxyacyl-[acyl-carrier-protein] dehydratase
MADGIDLIPHAAPWRLIDRVVASDGQRVEAEKLITVGDPLAGDELPEVLLLEALAQAAACLNAGGMGAHRGYLVAAQGFSFEGRARAGDRLRLVATRTATLGALHRFEGEASVEGRVLARGQMTFALEPA